MPKITAKNAEHHINSLVLGEAGSSQYKLRLTIVFPLHRVEGNC
jgi:hypothetical protein